MAILEKHCFACHGQEAKAGLRLNDAESWDEDLVVAGKPADSLLWVMVSGKGRAIMPPSGKLSKAELKALRQWIEKRKQ